MIRDVREKDLDQVLELNESCVPAVNSVPLEQMQWFAEHAAYFRVAAADDVVGGFLVGLRPGTSYASPNYRWFCDNYPDFAYVDRVAVAEVARRQGLASRFYDDFRDSISDSVDVMTCEVNIRPANESSMRFHEQYGFRQVASQETDGGDKEVALMVRPL
ncbi:MAG: GNAT family N-acetyltransferase [Woeseiaceae bacterium]|nr:GNAT family N-acetyltransferase [Woeseiaceae bacterium]